MPSFSNNDHELFQLIAQGDELAFRQLFQLYIPQIAPVIASVVQSEAPVKDIMQDIFLYIWISRSKLTAIEQPRNWIFRIVYFQSYKWLRQQGVRNKAQQQLMVEGEALHTSVEEQTQFDETVRLIKKAIQQLPPQSKKIYLLSREQQLKIADIAVQLQLSEQTVKNSITRSLKAIRTFLAQHDVHLPLILLSFSMNDLFL